MGRKIDRTGEERLNNFGSKMIIVSYVQWDDIDVYLPEYDYTINHVTYNNFKRGNIKCPYEPRYYGIGYLGEEKYKMSENGKKTKCYNTWHNMLERCYNPKYQEKYPTYKDCEACESWHNFQTFAEWYNNNYYQIHGEVMCLDKDILCKGNKIYSPETCVFVPEKINLLFIKSDNSRGKDPIGAHQLPSGNYEVRCNNGEESDYLGRFDNIYEAFYAYKVHKEKIIKQVADEYKEYIPQKLYHALYNYQVEITD